MAGPVCYYPFDLKTVGKWAYYSHFPCERLSYSSGDITGPVNIHLGQFDPKNEPNWLGNGLNTAIFFLRGQEIRVGTSWDLLGSI